MNCKTNPAHPPLDKITLSLPNTYSYLCAFERAFPPTEQPAMVTR